MGTDLNLIRRLGSMLLVVTALMACASGVSAQKDTAPWLTNPPADTPQHWYGAGEGPDAEAARRLALRAIAARLRSSISGNVANRIQETNGRVSTSASIEVSEDVLKTEFSGVEVQATAQTAAGTAVLVRVDKAGFVRDTLAQLLVVSKPVQEVETSLPSLSSLEQFLALRRVSEQIDQALTLSQLLVGAGAVAEGSPGIARFGGLQQRRKQVTAGLVFELRATPADADIANAVATYLGDLGMRSSTRKTPGANVLVINTQVREDELFGDKLVRLVVRLSVMDAQGRDVASREHAIKGASRHDFRGARQAAVKSLDQVMRKAGAMSALGFAE
jgi:hypothetical protein